MKKTVCIIIALAMMFTFVSCKGGKMSKKELENAIIDTQLQDYTDFTLESLEIVSRDTQDDTDAVSFTAVLTNSFSERTVSKNVVFKSVDGEWTVDSSEFNDSLGNSIKLTQNTLTDDEMLRLAAGYANYTSDNGSVVYSQMFIEPTDTKSAGYGSIINKGEFVIVSSEVDIENLSGSSQIDFTKSNAYFEVKETVDFTYYYDMDVMSWIIDEANVVSSSVEVLSEAALENDATVDGITYHIVITGADSNGLVTGTVDGGDISASIFAGSRLYGANIIARPHGANQVWYYMITGNNLSSMYTKSGTLA